LIDLLLLQILKESFAIPKTIILSALEFLKHLSAYNPYLY
jgi:hypothetical protein